MSEVGFENQLKGLRMNYQWALAIEMPIHPLVCIVLCEFLIIRLRDLSLRLIEDYLLCLIYER